MRGISHWGGIWEASERHISRWGNTWEASLVEETSERHLSLRRRLRSIWEVHMRGIARWRDIWEASLIEETSERHRKGSGSGKAWFSFRFAYVSWNNLLKNIEFSNILQNRPIKSIACLTICTKQNKNGIVFWYMVTRCISFYEGHFLKSCSISGRMLTPVMTWMELIGYEINLLNKVW